MERRYYFVYMVASKSRVLYIGMTNNLERRLFEHKKDMIEGFRNNIDVIGWFTTNRSMT